MNWDEILNTSSDICTGLGYNNDIQHLEDDRVIAAHDEFISRAADRGKQQQQSSEVPSAKAVTFSPSAVRSNNHTMPNRNQYGLYAARSEDDDAPPPISSAYGLHANNSSGAHHPRGVPSDVTSPIHNLSVNPSRDRTDTLESELTASDGSSIGEDTASGFSKKMLIKLMKEQVNIVRDLTNAQIANKRELEEMRAEKERLELERSAAVAGGNTDNANTNTNAIGNSNTIATSQMGRSNSTTQQQLKQAYQKTHGKQSSATKLNLPQTVQRDTSDSRSVSSKSIMDRFRRNGGPRPPTVYPRQHPDAKYYAHRNRAFSGDTYGEQSTLNNGGVSMASTILPTQITVGQDARPNDGYVNNQQQQQQLQQPAPYNRDKIEITPISERNVVPPPKKTCFTSFWWFFSHLVTLFIPNVFLCCIGRHAKYAKGMNQDQKKEVRKAKNEAKQAWREKVGIFVVMVLCSAVFIGVSGVIPMLLCRETTVFTMDEIEARDRTEDWTVIFGRIYDIKEYIPLHPGGDSILDVVGGDASKVFPRRPIGRLPDSCMNPDAELSTEVVCSEFDEVDKLVDLHCHTNIVGFGGTSRAFGKYEKGILAHRPQNLKNDVNTEWIMIYNRIYNVTSYIEGITDETTGKLDPESENAYLNEDLTTLIVNKRGEDATAVYEALYKNDVALSCLDDLFYIGILDEPQDL